MSLNDLIEIGEHTGEGYKRVIESDSWTLAVIRYSERFSVFNTLERHFETDEAFVLVSGKATMYLSADRKEITKLELEPEKAYTVKRNVWHHIVISEDACVLVFENRNTGADNTERVYF